MNSRPMNSRRGTILIVTMVVIFAIAAMVLTLSRQVRTQALASSNELAAQQADAAERGAEAYVLSLLTDHKETIPTLTETDFQAVLVGDAYFWINRPDFGDTTNNVTWGLLDEASKLPLNTATQEQLLGMPGMTDEIASGIVAWRGPVEDPTTTTTTGTVAAGTLNTALAADGVKNAPFETVDELLLVPGVTREILYGLPPAPAADSDTASTSSGDWWVEHGVADYFTAWSSVPNVAADGTARISYNDTTNIDALITLIGEKIGNVERAQLVRAGLRPPRNGTRAQLTNFFAFAERSGLRTEELALVEDYVTNDTAIPVLKGRVNINTASREVLLALGVLDEAEVDTLLTARPAAVATTPNSIAWVYEALSASRTKLTLLGPLITGRGGQYSADIVSANKNGRGFRHVRVVVDTTSAPARVVYRRDLTDRGWPMDRQILEDLKAGRGVGGQTATGTSTAGAR